MTCARSEDSDNSAHFSCPIGLLFVEWIVMGLRDFASSDDCANTESQILRKSCFNRKRTLVKPYIAFLFDFQNTEVLFDLRSSGKLYYRIDIRSLCVCVYKHK